MALRETLQRILTDYPHAKTQPSKGHPLGNFLRHDAEDAVTEALGEFRPGLLVEGSAGKGPWAAVPWISVFDPAITTSATEGYYVVYLFHVSRPIVHLSLNQGTTAVHAEFGRSTRAVLRDRAMFIRKRVADFLSVLPIEEIDLGSNVGLPGDYMAGHALGVTYGLDTLPAEETLRADLQRIVRAYLALTFRGGIEGDAEAHSELTDEFKIPSKSTVIETRKYAYHRKVERNRTAAKQAKKFHGTRCQACDLKFDERYGAIGKNFIEAHHLRPIASLEEGVAVTYDVAADFAVLCANCHRMIHKSADPSNLGLFRALVQSSKT
jgi:5-methylcytosine-specific restriction protein A